MVNCIQYVTETFSLVRRGNVLKVQCPQLPQLALAVTDMIAVLFREIYPCTSRTDSKRETIDIVSAKAYNKIFQLSDVSVDDAPKVNERKI